MTAEPVCAMQPSPSIPTSINFPRGGTSRIPDALKIIFIQGGMELEVTEAPVDGSAFKTFERPGIDRPFYANPIVDAKQQPRMSRSSRTKLGSAQPTTQAAAAAAAPVVAPAVTGRRERNKLGGSQARKSVSPPPQRPHAVNEQQRPARRGSNMFNRSSHGSDDKKSFFNRSRHGKDDDDEQLDNRSGHSSRSFFNRSSHGKDDLDTQAPPKEQRSLMKNLLSGRSTHSPNTKNKGKVGGKGGELCKGSAHMSSIMDRQKEKRSMELGLTSVHGTADDDKPALESTETEDSSSGSEAKSRQQQQQRNNNKRDLKATETAGLGAMRQAVQQQGDETEDPLDASSTHSNKSLGGLAAYPTQRSPQVFLDVMLRTRGYSIATFFTLETSYFNSPTELQMASYHGRLQDMIKLPNNVRKLKEILTSGISPNPCNSYGESLLHTACRNGYDASVRCMLEDCGSSVQVSDDCGRTPLHSAFFGTTPSYDIVQRLVKRDRHLLHLKDRHGATPLSYIPRDHWGMWIDYFYSNRDQFWPRRNKRIEGVAEACEKMHEKPNSLPLAPPPNALPKEMAIMVASGKLSPEEAAFLLDDGGDDETTADGDSTVCSDSMFSESLSAYDSMYDIDESAHSCATWSMKEVSSHSVSTATMFTARTSRTTRTEQQQQRPAMTVDVSNHDEEENDDDDEFLQHPSERKAEASDKNHKEEVEEDEDRDFDDAFSSATDFSGDSFA